MPKFLKAVAIFAELIGISRDEYKAFRKVVYILYNLNSDILEDVKALPLNLATLRDRIRKRILLINIREVDIPLKVEKLPIKKESKKAKDGSADPVTIKLTFFDPPLVFKNIIASDIY